ncbi:hypothetical protein WDU94_002758 [Cyamophila willieti]
MIPGFPHSSFSISFILQKASGPCAELRAQQLIASTPNLSQHNVANHEIVQDQVEASAPSSTNQRVQAPTNSSQTNQDNEAIRKLVQESSNFANNFARFISFPHTDENIEHFETVMTNFTKFLVEANNQLPGPVHPSVTYYRKRKQKKAVISNSNYRQSSNPQRSSQRQRNKRNEKYQYDLSQWQYANQRRKVAQTLLNSKKPVKLQVELPTIEHHFRTIYEN